VTLVKSWKQIQDLAENGGSCVSNFAIVRPGSSSALRICGFRLAQRARPAEYPRDIRSLEVMRSAVDLHDPSIEEKVVGHRAKAAGEKKVSFDGGLNLLYPRRHP
jgi:hypothetical protein